MPASTFMPDITVEIAFATPPDDPSPTWVDVSQYVEAATPITVTRGRSDELSEIQPSRLTITLDNSDGRFTPGNSSGAYYPNVKKNRQIRVSSKWPLVAGTTYRRFTGYIDEWPVAWPNGTGEYSTVTVTASSRRARLALGSEMPSIIEAEILADSPRAYYPMGEPSPGGGSPGQAGDVSGNQQPNMIATGSGTGIQWQAATGPGTDNLSAPVFSAGKYLEMVANVPFVKTTDTAFAVECFLNTTDTGGQTILALGRQSNPTYIAFTMDTDGTIFANTFGVGANSLHSTSSLNDNATHHIAYRESISGGTVLQTLYVDGVSEDSDTYSATKFVARIVLKVGEGYEGSISHVAIFGGTTATVPGAARIGAHATSGLTGFPLESTNGRIFRLAEYAGVDAFLVTETGVTTQIGPQQTTGRTPIELMDEVAETEGGLLFDAADGTLVFHARSHRYSATSQFTLDASEDQIEASLEVKMDGQQLVNDLIVTGASGVSVRVTNEDSIAEHGIRRDQIESLTTNNQELVDAANWRVQRYGEPDIRITAITVDLINQDSATISGLLATELGARTTLDNLPAQAPATSMDMFVEAINEVIGAEEYTITFELSPVTLSDVWILNSASFSQLDNTTVLAY